MPHAPPRVDALDATADLLADPYGWISARCDALGSDVFRARLLLQDTVCLRGREAAALLYDTARFRRESAMPKLAKDVLLGKGGVQGLDDAAHRRRKALWLSLMDEVALARFARLAEDAFDEALAEWEGVDELVLYDALVTLLARVAFRFAGVPVDEAELPGRATTLATLYESVAEVGFGHLRARRARSVSDRWAAGLVEAVREGSLAVPDHRPLARFASHRDLDGEPLAAEVAAVELENLLRPTIAVARWISFAVHALHAHPRCAEALRRDPAREIEPFVQEVRRCYPFFPVIAARTREAVRFGGYELPPDTRTLLDIPGTHHDPSVWEAPERFDPARFRERAIDPFALVAQGGGEHAGGHRCAGEWITLVLMRIAVRRFATELDWSLPEQDLAIVTDEVPARVASGMVLRGLRARRTSPRSAVA